MTQLWPTNEQLRAWGFVNCKTDGCTTWVNPKLNTSGHCGAHRRGQSDQKRRDQRFQSSVRFAPRPERARGRRRERSTA